jgi:hypothetical protein
MSRFFQRITEAEFRDLIRTKLTGPLLSEDEWEADELDEMTEEALIGCAFTLRIAALNKADNDRQKINFDLENCYTEKEDVKFTTPDQVTFCGINTLPNGLVYCGIFCGGDWESPVHFIVYWSGKEFRAYVPEDGNTYYLEYKSAYGSEFDASNFNRASDPHRNGVDPAKQRKFDLALIIADITNRIKEKI